MPKAFPLEFRRDVVAVARKGESTLTEIANNFKNTDGENADKIKSLEREINSDLSAYDSNSKPAENQK